MSDKELVEEAYLLARIRITGKNYIMTESSAAVTKRLANRGLAKLVGNRVELTQRGEDTAEMIESGMLDAYKSEITK